MASHDPTRRSQIVDMAWPDHRYRRSRVRVPARCPPECRPSSHRFHVAELAFGVDSVERERRLTGSGDSGEDHNLVPAQLQRDVLEVVLTRAPNDDRIGGHGTPDCSPDPAEHLFAQLARSWTRSQYQSVRLTLSASSTSRLRAHSSFASGRSASAMAPNAASIWSGGKLWAMSYFRDISVKGDSRRANVLMRNAGVPRRAASTMTLWESPTTTDAWARTSCRRSGAISSLRTMSAASAPGSTVANTGPIDPANSVIRCTASRSRPLIPLS